MIRSMFWEHPGAAYYIYPSERSGVWAVVCQQMSELQAEEG